MILRCRKHTPEVIGKKWFLLPAIFLIIHLRQYPHLERALLTGITRVSKESVFSDLNNLVVISTTSEKYAPFFGFTEEEVFHALDEFGLSDKREEVKLWYDGFTFGNKSDIYNPWSILNYLKERHAAPYWANTSSNHMVSRLIQQSSAGIKDDFYMLS